MKHLYSVTIGGQSKQAPVQHVVTVTVLSDLSHVGGHNGRGTAFYRLYIHRQVFCTVLFESTRVQVNRKLKEEQADQRPALFWSLTDAQRSVWSLIIKSSCRMQVYTN